LSGLLPSGGIVFLGDGYAFYAIPFYLADAIGGIGGPSKIMDVIGMEDVGKRFVNGKYTEVWVDGENCVVKVDGEKFYRFLFYGEKTNRVYNRKTDFFDIIK
jgi:hypothetical protein